MWVIHDQEMPNLPAFNHERLGDNDEHYTQPWVFEKLGITFDLDVCAPIGGIPWIPALKHYSLEDNALVQPWFGNVWMNPPYSKPTPWVEKFLAHGNGIALVPMTRGQWFTNLWEAADGIVIDLYNGKFERPDGTRKSITFRTAFIALGEDNVAALHRLGIGKVR